MTETSIIAWTTAIVGGASTLLTLACTKGVDAYLRWRAADHKDTEYQDGKEQGAVDKLIGELQDQLTYVRSELVSVREELNAARLAHLESVRREERALAMYENAAAQMERMQREIDSLREWRNSVAKTDHTAVMQIASDKTEGGK